MIATRNQISAHSTARVGLGLPHPGCAVCYANRVLLVGEMLALFLVIVDLDDLFCTQGHPFCARGRLCYLRAAYRSRPVGKWGKFGMLERFLRDYLQLCVLIHISTLLIIFSVYILARLDQVDWYFRAVRPYSPLHARYIMG